jgi:hypothetical protein
MILRAVLFVTSSGLVGWADMHSAIQDGRRLDVAPSGEDLRLRNRIVEHDMLIMFAPGFFVALAKNI